MTVFAFVVIYYIRQCYVVFFLLHEANGSLLQGAKLQWTFMDITPNAAERSQRRVDEILLKGVNNVVLSSIFAKCRSKTPLNAPFPPNATKVESYGVSEIAFWSI